MAAVALWSAPAFGHGDVSPQPVDVSSLPALGDEWLGENPYRNVDDAIWREALVIGSSGYNQNCARCHGLGAVSGGLAPDLRYLEAEPYGDEWYIGRYRSGYTQNGTTKMPAFGELLGQEAGWAIRTYVESRPDDDSFQEFAARLSQIRDQLRKSNAAEAATLRTELLKIAGKIETGSGAPRADSVALKAAQALETGKGYSVPEAVEILTIGLSAAQ